ncbi:hypothetical protein NU219Hw_g1257t1 [Hortaea werneckii]
MEASASESSKETEPGHLIFTLCGSIEHLVIGNARRWLADFARANEREDRIARRLALCPQTHTLRFHLEREDCDETRPFDDLGESFRLRDFLDRVICLHPAQRATPVADGDRQFEKIVVDYSKERQAVDRSKQRSKATTKREPDRRDERSGTKATSSKSVDAGPALAARSPAAVDSYVPSYSRDRTLAGSQKSVKHKPTPASGSKAPRTADSNRTHPDLYPARNKPFVSENQTREARDRKTHDALREAGEARHASRKQPRKDPVDDKLEKETTLGQKTPVSDGNKSGKERQSHSVTAKGKEPMRVPGLDTGAAQPKTAPRSKKRKEGKGTSDLDYVSDGESGGQSPKKKSKIDKESGKGKVVKKPR